MRSQDSRGGGRRGRGPRRSPHRSHSEPRSSHTPARLTLWQKIVAFFKPGAKSRPTYAPRANGNGSSNGAPRAELRTARKPETVDVTTTKLYVGNLSYEATENDLSELFNGVGAVRNAEVVAHRQTERSKGFGFVTMSTIEEAKRAVIELHDKEFMGRKLVVNGAKSGDREPNYRG